MKIAFCGPPHSGKTVLIGNLASKFPRDEYRFISTCPDGEGIWSNNENQEETTFVRKKDKYKISYIKRKCKKLKGQPNNIVLVDIGGKITEDKN